MLPPVIGIAIFIALIWIPVEIANSHYCFNNYDLGIYAQSLALLSFEHVNPFLSTLDVTKFSDHFDPILFFFAPLSRFIDSDLLAIRVDMLSIIVASLAPVWLYRKSVVTKQRAVVALFIILFSPMSLRAALFPAHPGTWAMAPLAWFLAFLLAGNFFETIVMFVLLLTCKEEWPVVGLAIVPALWVINQKRIAIWIFAISLIWGFGVFVLRPLTIGTPDFYAPALVEGRGLGDFLSFGGIFDRLEIFVWVFVPLCFFSLGQNNKIERIQYFKRYSAAFAATLALLAIRAVGGFWQNHRAAPLAVTSAFFVFGGMSMVSRKKMMVFAALLTVSAFPQLELGSRVWRSKSFKRHCPNQRERLLAIHDSIEYLRADSAHDVMAGGNLVPHLFDIPGVAQAGATKSKNFRYFLTEKGQQRNTWPLSHDQYFELESSLRSRPDAEIIRDDEYVLLIRFTSVDN